jgi:UDP-N-acetyl-D-glucosamine dehydrogenase
MPDFVLKRMSDALNQVGKPVRGSKIAVLGVAYKADIDDPRESPSFVLLERLLSQGALVTYNDPHIPRLPPMRSHELPELESEQLTPQYLAQQDCVLIATNHSVYDYDFIVKHAQLVVDTRNATRHVLSGREKIVSA